MGRPKNIQSFLKAPSSNLSPMQRLCRVLKGPGCYICGMCGKRYLDPNDAWKCLTSNGLNINSIPVIATNSNSQTYICLLCGKNYSNQPDTALCILKDLQAAKFPKVLGDHLHQLFASLAEQAEKTKRDSLVSRQGTIGAAVPKKLSTYKSPKIGSQLNQESSQSLSSLEDASNRDGSANQDEINAQEPAIDDGLDTTGEPMDHERYVGHKPKQIQKRVYYRKPNQKPFSRENAQYRCTVCNEKFFTKMEVETHFDGHPLVDDV